VNQATVSRELRRNAKQTGYEPAAAHAKARNRRKLSKWQGMKVAEDAELRDYVAAKLRLGWSPEQIAGRIKNIDRGITPVSPEAIYRFLYSAWGRGLWRFLRRAGYRRKRRRRCPKPHRMPVPNRVPISKRPDCVEQKKRCGDFEVDRVESGRDSRHALLVARDRKSGWYVAVPVGGRRSDENAEALLRALSPVSHVKTLTYDNDPAFAAHEAVNESLGARSYFCDPYSSWQKGGIENENGLLREYVPKGSDVGSYARWHIAAAIERLNHRPRKRLGYQTPHEVATESGMLKGSDKNKKHPSPGLCT
jgi:IS30 family transposase